MRDKNFDHNYDVFRSKLGHLDDTAKLSNTAVNHGRMAGLSAEDLAAHAAKPVLDAFNRLDTATGGLSTQIGAAVVGVTALGTAAAAAAKLWKAIMPAAAGAAEGGAGAAAGAAGGAAAGVATRLLPFVKGASAIGMLTYSSGLNEGEDAQTDAAWAHRKYLQSRGIPIRLKPAGIAHNEDVGMIRHVTAHVTPATLNGMEWTESRGNPNAISAAGAQGAYQFMPATAKHWGLKDPFNRDQSRAAAGRYMGSLLKRYHGNQTQALQAYNWGEGNMDSYLKTGYGVRGQAMPAETRNYPGQVAKGMTQNINVTINGASDPKATGREVHRQVQLASRNTAGLIR